MVNKNTKIIDPENESVSQLLGGLKRVQAPNDFDFRVKARIAKGRPADKTTTWLPVSIRYAIPLALFVLIGGYFGFSSMYSTDGVNIPTVVAVDSAAEIVPLPVIQPETDIAVGQSDKLDVDIVEVKQPEIATRIKRTEKTVSAPNRKIDRSGGGTYDAALRQAVNLTPSVIEPKTGLPDNVEPPVKKAQPSANDFLVSVGINANSAGIVQSVSGTAASGVKAGDVIESVNVKGRTIRLLREGRSIDIVIR